MLYVLPFPAIDPVLFAIGPFAIRWYALAYVVGILIGWRYARGLAARGESPLTPVLLDDFVTWAVLGIVLGGRIGYILFYDLAQYIEHPLRVFAVWQGGMAFHGGLLGMIIAMALFARRHHLRFFHLTDPVAAATPIGLFLGRLANFINGELYGRPTDVPWAMVFPATTTICRAIRASSTRPGWRASSFSSSCSSPCGASTSCASPAWRAAFSSSAMASVASSPNISASRISSWAISSAGRPWARSCRCP
jgi:prolipoprotein diacylglyceryl transferase